MNKPNFSEEQLQNPLNCLMLAQMAKDAAIIQAEKALGENLMWLTDQLDLRVRQGDSDTLQRLEQLTAAWRALAACLPNCTHT